ncbi:MAG: DNA cytosine methyltransferase [Gemmatimonadetes bacterium]|nr:DNA cytosine methyltransferase [Gemmatimonadota bacterium]
MKGGTMFSGIGAPECAAPWIDWRWCSEIDLFPSAVHATRFPGVRNLGDVTKVEWDAVEPVDVVVWGSPCQAFSVAGRRAGLDDPRGDLTLVGLAALGRVRSRWMVWENVPGVLSIDGGRTFGTVLGLMGELGYGVAYRVLDAQHFGVPQRRRRVFVVGCLGDWRRAAAVLFERASLSRNPAPGREAREDLARPLAAGSARGSGYRNDADTAENLPILPHQSASPTAVRRLMPVEAERLQGFPDGWTDILYRGKPAADGPRYKAIGNSMAVPVLSWLLDRIRQVDALQIASAA